MARNWAGAGTGALAGAGTGAAVGAIGGPVGAGIGAGVGGLVGGVAGLFSGNKDRVKNINMLTAEQKALISDYYAQMQGQNAPGGSYSLAQQYNQGLLSGDSGAYDRFAAPYKTQFEQQTLPMIAERFAGMGGGMGGGALSSSGFGQAIGGASAQYQSSLDALYASLQQAAADRAFGQYNQLGQNVLGTRAFEPTYQPGSTGFGGQAASGLLEGVGTAAGQGIGSSLSQRIADLLKPKVAETKAGAATGTTPNPIA